MIAVWFVIVGILLVGMALASTALKQWPVTPAIFYLAAGMVLGPWGLALLRLDPVADAPLLERITEIAVIVSLFTAGLKLRLPFANPKWAPPILLATVAMVMTIAGLSALGLWLFAFPLGAAILLGAVLAPTDPVLASDVQVTSAGDAERVRFSLTGEAGLNDGAAFPFVLLGLGILGHRAIGNWGWQWLLVDVGWASTGGIAIGLACGWLVSRIVLYFRRTHHQALGLDEFLAMGTIALAYGLAVLAHAYGFLAVFAAGLAMRGVEREESDAQPGTRESEPVQEVQGRASDETTEPTAAPRRMLNELLTFNERLERLCEFAVALVVGALLAVVSWNPKALVVAGLLFTLIRPLAIVLVLSRLPLTATQTAFIAWFGIRGVGSLYYLAYALNHGINRQVGAVLIDVTLVTIASSIVLHGVSVTPLMQRYEQMRTTRQRSRHRPGPDEAASRS